MNTSTVSIVDTFIRCVALIVCCFLLLTLHRCVAAPKTFIAVQMGFGTAMVLHTLIALGAQVYHLSGIAANGPKSLEYVDLFLNTAFFVDAFAYSIFAYVEAFVCIEAYSEAHSSKYCLLICFVALNLLAKTTLLATLWYMPPFATNIISVFVRDLKFAELIAALGFFASAGLSIAVFNYFYDRRISKFYDLNTATDYDWNVLNHGRRLYLFHILPFAVVLIGSLGAYIVTYYGLKDPRAHILISSLIFGTMPIFFTVINGLATKEIREIFIRTITFWVPYRPTATKPIILDWSHLTDRR